MRRSGSVNPEIVYKPYEPWRIQIEVLLIQKMPRSEDCQGENEMRLFSCPTDGANVAVDIHREDCLDRHNNLGDNQSHLVHSASLQICKIKSSLEGVRDRSL
ncbi:hypothetical protein L1987_30490 [Smallanthus sonchifolius]|uniref:Uncharacterized protein n=1 Tax=Smallanthus sonchifolius TaxID=185202 RepID=A0ACB9I2C0_9ASTR|nr:hypothetical protein L1987_30490 [Smallanthus sonchifolius]